MDLDLDAIEARAKAATPGPWEYSNDEGYGQDKIYAPSRGLIATGVGDSGEAEDTAKHIAGLDPQTVLALVARVREAGQLEQQRDMANETLRVFLQTPIGKACAAEAEAARLRTVVEKQAKALETAVRVAGEAADEWDRAPSGMKAGKLLIALSDRKLRYRGDINEMHEARLLTQTAPDVPADQDGRAGAE